MRTIDVGIGHDDNLIVAQLIDIGILRILSIYTEAYTDTLDDVHNRLGFEHAVPLYLLNVQNLTTQRQNSLEVAIATLLSRTTGRVTLDEEDFAYLRILL